MFTLRFTSPCVVFSVLLALGALIAPAGAQGQECQDTPEGRICHVPKAIGAGAPVDPEIQRQLGLVTINGCTGTLLNWYWGLTARPLRYCERYSGRGDSTQHYVRALPPSQAHITAAWAPGHLGLPSPISGESTVREST